MKIILVYNQESEIERNTMQTLETKLGNLIIAKHNFMDVRDILPVRATPAFVVLRDDLEGDDLLAGDVELKIEAEILKIMQEEELKVHEAETNRLDNFITNKVITAQDELLDDMIERGVL